MHLHNRRHLSNNGAVDWCLHDGSIFKNGKNNQVPMALTEYFKGTNKQKNLNSYISSLSMNIRKKKCLNVNLWMSGSVEVMCVQTLPVPALM